jgi:hypothetical protein
MPHNATTARTLRENPIFIVTATCRVLITAKVPRDNQGENGMAAAISRVSFSLTSTNAPDVSMARWIYTSGIGL